jgi:hypothetical protein
MTQALYAHMNNKTIKKKFKYDFWRGHQTFKQQQYMIDLLWFSQDYIRSHQTGRNDPF